ncbi:MAG: tripartite tricarboxylate transporter permease, partial [Angelakisella sp.]|nr:tripartite tricarboxylate transporter permease [Angelakisella sp.]
MALLLQGLIEVLHPFNLLWIIIGTFGGIVLGAIPGLTGAMGISLMIPLTYTMSPIPSICMLLGVYCGGTYGGSITAILINTPGSGASVVTAFDGYELAKKGEGGKALRMALYASFVGGIISALILCTISPYIAKMALKFGPCEYLALIILGLTVVGGISGDDIYKGIIAAALGLLVSMVGQDPGSGSQRLIFGIPNLISGVPAVPLLIGMFALSEILMQTEKSGGSKAKIEIAKMSGSQRLSLKEFL